MRAFLRVLAASAVLAGPARAALVHRYDESILRHARRRGLDPRLVKAVVSAESEFVPDAVSPSGALGLMQMMPATAREFGVPPGVLSDPEENIEAGTTYLAWVFGVVWRGAGRRGACCLGAPPALTRRALAAYHAGPRALRSREWPLATRLYVRKVMRLSRSPLTALRRPPPPAPRPAAPRERAYVALPKKRLISDPGNRWADSARTRAGRHRGRRRIA